VDKDILLDLIKEVQSKAELDQKILEPLLKAINKVYSNGSMSDV
jgi:hypothetical protein